jgi:hypothetical protein
MNFRQLVNSLLTAIFVTVCGTSVAAAETPVTTVEGLQLVEDSKLATVYAEPGINMGQYRRIFLYDPYIAFRNDWADEQNSKNATPISDGDMARIKIELSTLFQEVFAETLEDAGYELVSERAEDVLLVKPAIINLDIVAPVVGSDDDAFTYAESAGEMTLYLELYDSVTDDLIAKAMDRQKDRQTGYIRWQNRISNRAAARRILQTWADVLKEGLDDARNIR